MTRKNWLLDDTFDKPSFVSNTTIWNEWDELEPSERESIEHRYARNRNITSKRKLKKGTYAE